MEVCRRCDKNTECRVPVEFARFRRVMQHLEEDRINPSLQHRLRVFLSINHCIAEGELDIIHSFIAGHEIGDETPGDWRISDDLRQRMLALRRQDSKTA
jgi:hypothetical protein